MTISYKWLCEYLPVALEPERLSRILTSIGLEVESLRFFEEVKGGLKGLVIGEVLTTEKHPNADKLTLTTVNTGNGTPLQIVCGAPNVAAGQHVVVAPVGATIHPTTSDPLTMKVAKIRGVESQGMICAEDEIGLGSSHAGILVLPATAKVGLPAADYFKPYTDWVFEIGLTPNRMDAMSHWGVARDVCAYLSHHDRKDIKPKLPNGNGFRVDNTSLTIDVKVENFRSCPRYSGLSIANLNIAPSPKWMQDRLKAIGLRPINNIVDITNYVQHETGQPLHAFDLDAIGGRKVVVKNLPEGTRFTTLDEKERSLHQDDLMICDEKEGMCIAGVFGGMHSGVTERTRNIFLESAFFEPIGIRKTSFRHGLRTDAASRFEKGTDISATVPVLKRAAGLIREICGGEIASEIVDIYPIPAEKKEVKIKYHYLKKLSGKNYHPDAVRNILESLGFETIKEGIDELWLKVPFHKPDISLPADIVEEILRIDGLDNIEIPNAITITPSVEEHLPSDAFREKIANYLVGLGFFEILTNSITNAAYYSEEELQSTVKMLNSLSAELNIMRPSMLETGLESIAHNLNRKNTDLKFFEYGRTYSTSGPGNYAEAEHLCLFVTGNEGETGWREKAQPFDFYRLKGVVTRILQALGISSFQSETASHPRLEYGLSFSSGGTNLLTAGLVNKKTLRRFDIKQPVFFADLNWQALVDLAVKNRQVVKGLPRFPAVNRDLAIIVPSQLSYSAIEQSVEKLRLSKLQDVKLFDIFESEKLGSGRKSMAISFTFVDEEKTLTDKEIDTWMNKIMAGLEKELQAEIRKG